MGQDLLTRYLNDECPLSCSSFSYPSIHYARASSPRPSPQRGEESELQISIVSLSKRSGPPAGNLLVSPATQNSKRTV